MFFPFKLIHIYLGGEPFLVQRGRFLGELVKYCKKDLKMESVTIVSNGSLITEVRFVFYVGRNIQKKKRFCSLTYKISDKRSSNI